jgi:hypothetical protein
MVHEYYGQERQYKRALKIPWESSFKLKLRVRFSAFLKYFSRNKIKMPENRNAEQKVSPALVVLPLVRIISPASAFQYWCKSGTASHGLFR